MIRMFKELKGSYRFILIIVALLFLQAYCDLSLPSYTSNIINVGVQQGGIEDSVPDEIRSSSMEQLMLFMDEDDQETVKEAYELTDEIYTLKKIGDDQREQLNEILGVPMVAVESLREGDTADAIKEQMGLPAQADLLETFAALPEEQRSQMTGQLTEQLEEMPDSIITQSSVAYIRQEYQEMGKDLDQIQMQYVLFSGLKMLGFAAVIMAASVLVTKMKIWVRII